MAFYLLHNYMDFILFSKNIKIQIYIILALLSKNEKIANVSVENHKIILAC